MKQRFRTLSSLLFSTSIAVSGVKVAPWRASPHGPSRAARRTCGGTTSKQNRTADIRTTGMLRSSISWSRQIQAASLGAAIQGPASPYGTFTGKTIFEAAKTNVSPEGAQKALGYLPTDEEWSAPNRYEDHPSVPRRASKANTSSLEKRCRTIRTWFSIWRESAIIARTLRAWLLARAMRSTSVRRMALC